jgi:hypothetical protein
LSHTPNRPFSLSAPEKNRVKNFQTAKICEGSAKAVLQLLFARARVSRIDGLREKLREFFREGVRAEDRPWSSLDNFNAFTQGKEGIARKFGLEDWVLA